MYCVYLKEPVALLPEFDRLFQVLGSQFGLELKVPDGWAGGQEVLDPLGVRLESDELGEDFL